MSNMHKSVVSFPKVPQDLHPGRTDEANSYLDYLLELADRLFRGEGEREDELSS